MIGIRRWCVAVLSVAVLSAGSTMAADGGPTVSATGHASSKMRAEILRMKLMLTADGKTTREAISDLVQKRDALKANLVAMGGSAESFDGGEPVVGTGELSMQQRQMQMMMRAQRNVHPTSQPSTVTVSSNVSIDFPLTGEPGEAVVTADELEAKIKQLTAKGGAKKPLTAEEQEVAEETAAGQAQESGDGSAAKPGEPSFSFVHKLSDTEREKAMSDAVADAVTQAKRLAKGAGKTIGELRQLSAGGAMSSDENNPYSAYLRAYTGQETATKIPTEAVGTHAGSVLYETEVNASFELK